MEPGVAARGNHSAGQLRRALGCLPLHILLQHYLLMQLLPRLTFPEPRELQLLQQLQLAA